MVSNPLVGSEVSEQWGFSAPALRSLCLCLYLNLNGCNFPDACSPHRIPAQDGHDTQIEAVKLQILSSSTVRAK
jgi:hypothetical protein